jgi:hypothetical protein
VGYAVNVANAKGSIRVEAELLFQSIGYRWAQNLKAYDAAEPKRFSGYYAETAQNSAELIASASAVRL